MFRKHKEILLNGNMELLEMILNKINNKGEKNRIISQHLEEVGLLLALQKQLKYKGIFIFNY